MKVKIIPDDGATIIANMTVIPTVKEQIVLKTTGLSDKLFVINKVRHNAYIDPFSDCGTIDIELHVSFVCWMR